MSSAFASSRRFLPPRARCAVLRQIAVTGVCLTLAGTLRLAAQNPGDVDPAPFLSAAAGFNVYTQLIEYINGTPFLFAAGDQTGLQFENAGDGSLDSVTTATFTAPDFGAVNRIVYTAVPEVVTQATGTPPNILLGGQFGRSLSQFNKGQSAQNIVRISAQGVLDTTFNPGGKGANGFVTSVVPLSDGTIVAAGEFEAYNGQSHVRFVRLDNNGVPLPGNVFSSGLSFDATVLSVALQVGTGQGQTSQFVVAGQFSSVSGTTHQKLARINNDGSVDGSFNPSFDDRTTIVVAQPDGKILVGGDFSNVNGQPHKHVVRLNYDGSVDPTFGASVTGQPFGFIDPPAVYVIKLLDDGRMYLGGNFTTVNGVTHNYLARVNADGTLDPTFDAGRNLINAVQSITIQADGRLLVGETLSKKNGDGVLPPSLLRLYAEPPSVTLLAKARTIVESSKDEVTAFKLKRDNFSASGPLTVYFQLGGTATLNKDYKLPSNVSYDADTNLYFLTFPTGRGNAQIALKPKGRPTNKRAPGTTATVTLTVVADPTGISRYPAGGSATVNIVNR